MIAARQEIDLRPQLERLDRLLMASAGVAPGALGFTFRPLWQMDAATKAATALQKAQASGIYAGLGLWPKAVMAGLVAGQLAEDGIYPDAGAAFEAGAEMEGLPQPVRDYSPDQPRDPQGRWSEGGESGLESATSSTEVGNAAPDFELSHISLIKPAEREIGRHVANEPMFRLAASADDPQGLKMARAVARAAGLNREQQRIFHDAITKQGITDYQELLSIAQSVKRGERP